MKVDCAALVMWLWANTMSSKQTDYLWTGWCVTSQQQTSFSSLTLQLLNVDKATGRPTYIISMQCLLWSHQAFSFFTRWSHIKVTLSVSHRHNSDWAISLLFTESYRDTLRTCLWSGSRILQHKCIITPSTYPSYWEPLVLMSSLCYSCVNNGYANVVTAIIYILLL